MPTPAPAFRTLLDRILTSPGAVRAWRLLVFVLVATILYLALSPAPPKTFVDTGWDKANHGLAFVALTVASCFAYVGRRRRLIHLWLALLAFGAGIELAQLWVPPRSAELYDLLADAVGMAIGTALARGLLRLGRLPE